MAERRRSTGVEDASGAEGRLRAHVDEPAGSAGFASSAVNLLKSILGSGMLALPNAVATLGVVPGLATLLVAAVLSATGVQLLVLSCNRVVDVWRTQHGGSSKVAPGPGAAPKASAEEAEDGAVYEGCPPRQTSYAQLTRATYPRAALVIEAAVALKCTLTSSSYMKVFADIATKWVASRTLVLAVAAAALVPLALMRRMDSLKYTSMLGLAAIAYLFALVAWMRATGAVGDAHALVLFRAPDVSALKTFSVFVFALTCHQNVFPLHNEMRANGSRPMAVLVLASYTGAYALYAVFVTLALGVFGPGVADNVTNALPKDGAQYSVAHALYAVLMLFSVPLQTLPARTALLSLAEKAAGPAGTPRQRNARHITATLAILAVALGIASCKVELKTLMAVVGATAGTTICYFLPATFAWGLFAHSPRIRTLAAAVFAAGCLATTIPLYALITTK